MQNASRHWPPSSGLLPLQSPETLSAPTPTPQRSEDTTLPPLAAKKGKVSHLDFLLSQNGAGDGQIKTFFSYFFFFLSQRFERTPSQRLRGEGNPLNVKRPVGGGELWRRRGRGKKKQPRERGPGVAGVPPQPGTQSGCCARLSPDPLCFPSGPHG